MPFPTKGETQEHYMHRWMGSSEAKASFPKRSQLIAVGLSEARQHHLAHAVRNTAKKSQKCPECGKPMSECECE